MSTTPDNLPLETITAALRAAALGGRELWGYDEIAAYSKFEKTYVVNVIAAKPDFPRPIRVVNARSHPRWKAGDVMDWFEARQEKG